MGGTKIFVLQMKQIRKVCVVAAAVLVALLIVLFVFGARPETTTAPASPAMPAPPAQRQQQPSGIGTPAAPMGSFTPGTYYSEIVLSNSTIVVSVEVSENSILNVSISDAYEAQAVFYPLMQPTMDSLSARIIEAQSLDIARAGNHTYTQEVLITAIRAALDSARR
ncbi:MAG: hypothetical protein FWD98_04145 [Defluviitaleaceae bacterium]|nr:hypothetical protein [Defluviitaleaceae bacterium]